MVLKVIALVLPLGLDTFAVAAALGALGTGATSRARISALFTAFEAGMPLIGLGLGAPLAHLIGPAADYLAIAVLLGFGIYMLVADEEDGDERIADLAQARGAGALLLGVSISLDELAIGFTLGLLRVPAALVIALIAVQAFVVTQLGLTFGRGLSERIREGAEKLAGAALAGLALVLIAEKLL